MSEMAAMSVAACGLANKYGAGTNLLAAKPKEWDQPGLITNAAHQRNQASSHLMRLAQGYEPVNPNAGISILTKSMPTKRLVRVFLVDPNESVPLDSSMLYKSDEKLTDLTDQELFFEIPVQELLTKHNALRATLLDKAATKRSNKDVMLEPAKIRDLTMTVLVLETW